MAPEQESKRRLLAIEWEGWSSKGLSIDWNGMREGGGGVEKHPTTPPVDRVKCVQAKQPESTPEVRSVESMFEKVEVVKNVVNFKNENGRVLSTKFEKKLDNKTVGKIKKRTWTKLNNGLFGWKTTVVTTSNSLKQAKDKNVLPAIKGGQNLNISTGTSPFKRKFGVGSRSTGVTSESESSERDYLAKKPRMHGGNQI